MFCLAAVRLSRTVLFTNIVLYLVSLLLTEVQFNILKLLYLYTRVEQINKSLVNNDSQASHFKERTYK